MTFAAFPDMKDCKYQTSIQSIFNLKFYLSTESFTASGLRNEAVTGLFLDFWGPQRLLWTPKDGRKLLLGKKHTTLILMVSPDGGQKKDKFQDLVN